MSQQNAKRSKADGSSTANGGPTAEPSSKKSVFADGVPQTVASKYTAHGTLVQQDTLMYIPGFGGERSSEARDGALPIGQNTPQKAPLGLYAEQLSGTAFTEPRETNQRTWFYRIHPSAGHTPFAKYPHPGIFANFDAVEPNPNQFRWMPFKLPEDGVQVNFVDGLRIVAGAGHPSVRSGLAYYIYTCNTSMVNQAFCDADGDLLLVPQQGTLNITTEHGRMIVHPNEICVIPRGIRFVVAVDGPTRGYICEIFDGHFQLPNLGPIGANGLANPRDFLTPVAWFEEKKATYTIFQKFGGAMFTCSQDHSPFDVVAWHGNYTPFKYDLAKFCVVNSVSFDHIDPSIFTVLTCPSELPGRAAVDFVIFPPRWSVHEHTFRLPYYHRNCMSEFMGLIHGHYEAKSKGFMPGGATLHSIMSPHGPDRAGYEAGVKAELEPEVIATGTQAFMFETFRSVKITPWALNDSGVLDADYVHVWDSLPKHFQG